MRHSSLLALAAFCLITIPGMPSGADSQAEGPFLREQQLRPLPGRLDELLLLNDNNPELITGEGVLLSTFPANQGLNVALDGRFDLFSHHVYAGQPEELASTLWLAVLAQPLGTEPVTPPNALTTPDAIKSLISTLHVAS